jgi:phytoene dehydrogenase-like protein
VGLGWNGFKEVVHQQGVHHRGFVYDDDTALVIWGTRRLDLEKGKVIEVPENFEKNYKEIARFSEKDADTVSKWYQRFQGGLRQKIEAYLYNPPPAPKIMAASLLILSSL